MKKLVLFLLFPILLFSYELTFSKKFSINVTPDLLKTFIDIEVEDEEQSIVNKNIEVFNEFIKKDNSVLKRNGTLTVSPKYRYYKNKQEFTGYVGSLRYEIKANNAKKINTFIDKLIELRKEQSYRKVKLNISNLSWIISDDKYISNLDNLRLDTLIWLEKYTKELSKDLNKFCIIKKVDIENLYGRENFARVQMSMQEKVSSNVAPQRTIKEISVKPRFLLECK